MKFRPDIEGLRGVAVLFVVAYHAAGNVLPGGYSGVDIFFVISGFLITKIILDDIAKGSFSLATFYARRIRRIFPALFVMLAVGSVLALVLLPPQELMEYGKTLFATSLFLSNVEFYRISDYFADPAELKPLLHTWSLGVEEQFYIVFPLLLIATKRWLGGRFLLVFLLCGVLSFLLSLGLLPRSPRAAFFLGPPRAFELLIGAVLALNRLPALSARLWREAAAAAGMGLIVFYALFLGEDFGGAIILVCLGAALLIYAGQSGTSVVTQALSLAPIRFVGAISYSLYLWHWLLLAFAKNYRIAELLPVDTAIVISAAFAIAILSWRFVEQPFRTVRGLRKPFAMGAASIVGFAAAGFFLLYAAGFPARFPAEAQRLFAYRNDYNQRVSCHDAPGNRVPYAASCVYGAGAPVVAIWGDSLGAELSQTLSDALAPERAIVQITSSGCPTVLDFKPLIMPICNARNHDVLANLARDTRIHSVILMNVFSPTSARNWLVFHHGLERVVMELRAAGKHVVLVGPTPNFSYSVPSALGLAVARGRPVTDIVVMRARYDADSAPARKIVDAIAAKFDLPLIVPADIFCAGNTCPAFDGRDALYFDRRHLSMTGAKILAAAIVPVLKNSGD